jgi:DNA-binding response OmpR family regulator
VARRILVVEDDQAIGRAIVDRLTAEAFEVEWVTDGLEAVARATAAPPDLVVLDLGLPGIDGLEVCRRLHRDRAVPVIMLTARDDEADLLTGLAVGADDYLTKPFSMRVLVARIQTVLRRTETAGQGLGLAPVIRVNDLTIDQSCRLVTQQGNPVALTPTEFDLLACLALQPGTVKSREQLLFDVWGYRDSSGARTVDSHVRALRRKLGDGAIRTVHGVGYGLALPT